MKLPPIARVFLVGAGPLLVLAAGCERAASPDAGKAGPSSQHVAAAEAEAEADATPTAPDALPDDPAPEPAEGGPELTFVSLEHDYGEMWNVDTDPKNHGFEFTNTGDSLLVISEIKPDCGCTTAELDKKEYEPGEGSVIEVTYDPKNRQGRQTKTINIVTNAERQGPVKLRITADVKPFVALEPRRVELGDVRRGEARTAIVELGSPDPDLVIESIDNAGRHVEARVLDRPVAVGPLREGEEPPPHRIEVTLGAEAPWGETSRTLMINCRGRLESGGEEIAHRASLSVKASVFGELRADPPNFRLGSIGPDEPVEKRVRLTSTSGTPFTILDARLERASLSDLQLRADPIDEAGVTGYELVLTGNSGSEAPKSIYGSIVVETEVEGEERLELPLYGIVRTPSS